MIEPLKLTKVSLFTMVLHNSENSICDIRVFCRPLFCHSNVVKYSSSLLVYSSEPVTRLDCQILLKSHPLTLAHFCPELTFFITPPASVCFHTLLFWIVLLCFKLAGKIKYTYCKPSSVTQQTWSVLAIFWQSIVKSAKMDCCLKYCTQRRSQAKCRSRPTTKVPPCPLLKFARKTLKWKIMFCAC